ncbi:MAG TPA: Stp1/IreP family PP2C-type Ser/Thr phosphatase [Thermoanaerobaculia bacterium]|nr:Stp1/IreP family PP2C-type Ser/Thr phosphatase [Thermoanaerobaculia bacterium]
MNEQATAQPAVSPGRLLIQAALRTDVGLVRSENQDFGTYTSPSEEKDTHPGGRLLVVADGMGGHRGGATASRLAGETVKAQYLGGESDDVAAALRDALQRANSRIYNEAQANPDLRGMGTTTSALAIKDDLAWFGHVGDSRIYRVRGDEIEQLTDDHSLVATMVREGLLTAKEAETHPRRNVLQRSMGVTEDVEVDVKGPFDVQEGDTFILCSDGLHGLVKQEEILEVAKQPIDVAADDFVKRVLERGAPDNVTVIVARAIRAMPGDDDVTLLDHKRAEKTQEIAAVDTASLEPSVMPSEVEASPASLGKPAGDPSTSLGVTPSHTPVLKWLLIVVLLAAAGAWFFWNR